MPESLAHLHGIHGAGRGSCRGRIEEGQPMTDSVNDDAPEMRQRRELLRRAAWLLGGAVSAPAALAILQGCSAKESAGPGAALKFLDAAQLETVAQVAEIMLPRTDTSGARDAGVPEFIDRVLDAVYAKPDQQRFTSGLAAFEKDFLDRDPAQRPALVKQALDTALAADADDKPFILMVRELTL